MSRTHDIDNEDHEPLFEFDSYEPVEACHLEATAREPQSSSSCIGDLTSQLSALKPLSSTSSHREQPPDEMDDVNIAGAKGKGISQPIYIKARGMLEIQSRESADDLFTVPLGSATFSQTSETVPELSISASSSGSAQPINTPSAMGSVEERTIGSADEEAGSLEGKGKARELPPSLPPLSFITTGLNYESLEWPSFDLSTSIPGPSSYGSGYESSPGASAVDGMCTSPDSVEDSPSLARMPSRRRSLSNLSVQSKRSISALSITKVKVKLSGSKGPGNLARKLLFKKRPEDSTLNSLATSTDGGEIFIDPGVPGCTDAGQASCLTPWAVDVKPRESPLGIPVTPVLGMELSYEGLEPSMPFYFAGRPSDNSLLRTKGRSYSSPLPLPSTALDLVPVVTTDIFKPYPLINRNYFDAFLPNELKLHVLASLVDLHTAEHQRHIQEGKWTVRKASTSKNKWVGRDRGIRELFKLSRVSKSWQALVFDGQLWTKLDLRSFPRLPQTVLAKIAEIAGSFVQRIDFSGHTELSPTTLIDITDHLCIQAPSTGSLSHTHLTHINLQGCASLTTRSLHHILIHSPSVRGLCLRGLSAVTNTTCDILAVYCSKLVSLDLSRCSNMSGDGVYTFASATLIRNEYLALKELRLSGVRRLTDDAMAALGKAAPLLEVLDLSYARDLHNSAIEALVSCTEEEATECDAVRLTSREAGRDPTDWTTYWRRVTRLRHLSLSFCLLLTDHACSHLAHAVPKLEFLEMAGLGAELRDGGLIRLLDTTPLIRRLDLEDASDITDDVLFAITPEPVIDAPRQGAPASQPGHALEHLVISNASEITNDALLELIRSCTRLRHLEADGTRMSGTVVKEFVRLARERELTDSQVVAIDCRGVGEQTVKDLVESTRPRIGWRSYEARKLGFLDARDEEALGVGQDECDAGRVALKTFYSWQTVDAVRSAREKKRKLTRWGANVSSSSTEEPSATATGRARWWSPSGRRSEANSPMIMDSNIDREGCMIM